MPAVMGQTVPFDEVILVNDGSADRSREICEEYCANYPEIFLINQKNAGQSEARNVGLKKATGEYIVFVDSDDSIRTGMVEVLRRELANRKPDILYYNASIYRDMQIKISDYEYIRTQCPYGRLMTGIESIKVTFPQEYIMTPCMAAYKKIF